MIQDWLIPVAAMGAPVLIVYLALRHAQINRKMAHLERMAMIEKGLIPPEPPSAADWRPSPRPRDLSGGIITALVGLVIVIGLSGSGRGPWLLAGLIPLAVGTGNIISYLLTKQPPEQENGTRS